MQGKGEKSSPRHILTNDGFAKFTKESSKFFEIN